MNRSSPLQSNKLDVFGIEILHHRSDAVEVPPDCTASETLGNLEKHEQHEAYMDLADAAHEVSKVVVITRGTGEDKKELVDIFTAEQIIEMRDRIHGYLGKDIDSHLAEVAMPANYPYYIGRLATHFTASNSGLITSFGSFVDRHTDPLAKATGPKERNSRELANWANESLLKQFESFYQSELNIELVGPTKKVEGSRISWEKGIAESQFLVLDYVRDLLTTENNTRAVKSEVRSMTISDIKINIVNLLVNKNRLVAELTTVNPIIAEQVASSIDGLRPFTTEVFHRGRLGKPRYEKEPDNARRALIRIETLLMNAASLAESRADQAEIPILDD